MEWMIDAMGWAGAIMVVGAYALLSFRFLSSERYTYHAFNMLGSFWLGIYAFYKHASASMVVNAVWLAIGAVAVARIYAKRTAVD